MATALAIVGLISPFVVLAAIHLIREERPMIEREPWKPRWLLVAKSCPGLEAGWHAIKDEMHYDTGERLGCGVTVVSTRRIETTDDVGYEPPADETCPGCLAWIERRNAR